MNGPILTLLALLQGVLMFEITSRQFFRVKNVFFGDPSSGFCLIGSEAKRSALKSECHSRCNIIPHCFLTCFNGSSCRYYDSLVSTSWNPQGDYLPLQHHELMGFDCYSSYYLPGDITDRIVAVKAVKEPRFIQTAIDGYYCAAAITYYETTFTCNPWIEFQFNRTYPIRKVLVFTIHSSTTYFEEVEVRVGSVPGRDGDFSAQTFFDFYQGMADRGEVVIFQANGPINGRFLSLNIQGVSRILRFKEIKIIV